MDWRGLTLRQALDMVDFLPLSVRAEKTLKTVAADIDKTTLGELEMITREQWLGVPNAGKTTYEEISNQFEALRNGRGEQGLNEHGKELWRLERRIKALEDKLQAMAVLLMRNPNGT